ncbi:MAG: hypothetical protein HYU71_15700 [Bacteroidetes bacterium]|nr:hypothetical protein [Bacteroidota bacterium]
MEELYEMVKGLHNLLEHKRAEIEKSGKTMDSYLLDEFVNQEREIGDFAKSVSLVNVSTFEITVVIENFKRGADGIKERIANIGK